MLCGKSGRKIVALCGIYHEINVLLIAGMIADRVEFIIRCLLIYTKNGVISECVRYILFICHFTNVK